MLYLSKRVRRYHEGVKCHTEVYVRSDTDIDTLRQSSTMRVNPHKTPRRLRSVLRANTQIPLGPVSMYARPVQPSQAHTIARLSDNVLPRPEGTLARSISTLWPRRRNTDGDYELVDTSCQFKYDSHLKSSQANDFKKSYEKAMYYWKDLSLEVKEKEHVDSEAEKWEQINAWIFEVEESTDFELFDEEGSDEDVEGHDTAFIAGSRADDPASLLSRTMDSCKHQGPPTASFDEATPEELTAQLKSLLGVKSNENTI